MEVRAQAKTVIISARKARLTMNLIRGKDTAEALNILRNLNKKASYLITKVLKSAIANAENNHNLDKNKLYIKEAYINDGPILKRHRFGSRGHIDRHDKKTSHITIVVAERN